MTPTIQYNLRRLQNTIYSRCHTKRGIGGKGPANPSFGMTMSKILKDPFLWHTSHLSLYMKNIVFMIHQKTERDEYISSSNNIHRNIPNNVITKQPSKRKIICNTIFSIAGRIVPELYDDSNFPS